MNSSMHPNPFLQAEKEILKSVTTTEVSLSDQLLERY